MKIIFTLPLFFIVNISNPLQSKDISPDINGKLKDECLYLTNLIERAIQSAYRRSPTVTGEYESLKDFPWIVDDDEYKRLEYLNPKNTSLLKLYLDLCK